MELRLKGKTALITGGTVGIGLAVARAFAREGVSTAICGRDGERAAREALAIERGRTRSLQPTFSGGASCPSIFVASGAEMVQGTLRGWQGPADCHICSTTGAPSDSENAGQQHAGRCRVAQSWHQCLVCGGHVSD